MVRNNRQQSDLAEAADTYWRAVRWGDIAGAGMFLADAQSRLNLSQMVSDPGFRLVDAAVIQVAVSLTEPDEDPLGLVLVRVEGIELRTNHVEIYTFQQNWKMTSGSWFVDTALSPLGADRPWVLPSEAP